ncbi:MAG: TraX family protein [Peptostreptococcaceae bacterium]|nr:TraX family protein [Peptostreptococcaceae bacterium]
MSENAVLKTQNHGVSMNTLKYIAIFAMLLDHIAHVFVPYGTTLYVAMRFIGRITGPVMFYAAVEGYHHTRDIRKYLMRLGIFALISYFPFILCFEEIPSADIRNYLHLNVIFTILMAVLAIHIRREMRHPILKWTIITLMCFLTFTSDWGIVGFVMIILFDYYYGDFRKQAFAYLLLLFFGQGLWDALVEPIESWYFGFDSGIIWESFFEYHFVQFGMILPIILLSFYKGERGSDSAFSKWVFYIFYPAHLLLLGIVNRFLI